MSNAVMKAKVLSTLNTTSARSRMKAQDLAYFAGVPETDTTCPTTRSIIRDLIDDGHVIGATSAGYCLMRTGKEVQNYLNSLLQREMAISARILAVYNAAKKNGVL
jgi:hypothetical protein